MMTEQKLRTKTMVWDRQTRAFHWSLVLLFTALSLTGFNSEDKLSVHIFLGEIVTALVVWRSYWGFRGSYHSRFSSFLYSPADVWLFVTNMLTGKRQRFLGHNPLAGWMVIVLLGVISVQIASGLFGSDGIALSGPLAEWIAADWSEGLGNLHAVNYRLLLLLIAAHVLSVVIHLMLKDDILTPMITGRKLTSPPHRDIEKIGKTEAQRE
ncbi:hypothetical protein HBA55_02145 [Pseudomaricurvus alkylphenolicus]|uniref:cytochrome b/b6 domain-containing protein n=1 Tax=Pseudomaricurvus alkylphenolicus TaxID=1306991 RepID=UPI0014238055|nr:cytochrome b/b6 domain-containing protein [Pseudomaricurvus alkylphenolicus]NIB38366.1 hypothetical protein [Pseudomaricurvus alkylphenolicus]